MPTYCGYTPDQLNEMIMLWERIKHVEARDNFDLDKAICVTYKDNPEDMIFKKEY